LDEASTPYLILLTFYILAHSLCFARRTQILEMEMLEAKIAQCFLLLRQTSIQAKKDETSLRALHMCDDLL